jgi:hypothetical protein
MTLRERMAAFESRIPDRDHVYLNDRSIYMSSSVIFLKQANMMPFPTRFNRLVHLNGQEAHVIVLSISNDRLTYQSKAIRTAERGFNDAGLEFQRCPVLSGRSRRFMINLGLTPKTDGHETTAGNWMEISRLSRSVPSAATLARR